MHHDRVDEVNRTPPAPAAIAGAMRILAFLSTSTASGVHGIFEPSGEKARPSVSTKNKYIIGRYGSKNKNCVYYLLLEYGSQN